MQAGGAALSVYVAKRTSPAIFHTFFRAVICTSLSLLLVLETLFRSLKSKQHSIIMLKGVGAIDHTAHQKAIIVCFER
jgi:hypothetical protein